MAFVVRGQPWNAPQKHGGEIMSSGRRMVMPRWKLDGVDLGKASEICRSRSATMLTILNRVTLRLSEWTAISETTRVQVSAAIEHWSTGGGKGRCQNCAGGEDPDSLMAVLLGGS